MKATVVAAVGCFLAASAWAAQPPAKAADPASRNANTRWVNEPKPGSLPTGVTHHTFFSKALKRDVGYCIYLPPGYAEATDRRYHVREFHAALLAAGVDHTYWEVEGLAHEHDKLVNLYAPVWFDYHAESFRRAARAK